MKIILKWSAFGFAAFLAALIYTIPAHLILPYLPSFVHISRLSGTIWNAQATDLVLEDFAFNEVMWRIQPLFLLTGRLKTRVKFDNPDMSGSTDIILGYRSLNLEDLHVTGNTAVIGPYLNTFGASINGKFDLMLESLKATQSGPQQTQGRLIVYNSKLTSPTELSLGDIELNLEQQEDTAVATLKNSATNALKMSGTVKINPEWRYSSGIRIAPTSTTPDAVRQTLTLLGRADARGSVTIKHNGQIPILHWLPYLQDSESVVSSQ